MTSGTELILIGWKIVPNEEHVQYDHRFASQPLANEPLHSSQRFDTSLQKARGTTSLCGPWAALHFLASFGTIFQPMRINSVPDVKCFCNNKNVLRAQSMVWHFVCHPVSSLQLRISSKSAGWHSLHSHPHMRLSPGKVQIKMCQLNAQAGVMVTL
jgi:hypothetical protein